MLAQNGTIASGWKHMRSRFGIVQPLLVIGSTIGIVLIMAALTSLWRPSFYDKPNSLRSIIARRGDIDSTITACCALLRAFMAVQIGTCGMMLATLAFEKNCILLRDAAAVSMYRYAATPPWALAIPVFRGTKVSKNVATIVLVLLLSIVTILSQLLSTILLLDLGPHPIHGPRKNISFYYWNGTYLPFFKPLASTPKAFPRFAELRSNNFSHSDSSTGPGLKGTGKTLRALFPLGSSLERSSLIYYEGIAGLLEAHVLCMSPEIKNITFRHPDRISGKLGIAFAGPMLELQDSFRWSAEKSLSDVVFDFDCNIEPLGRIFILCPLRSPATTDCPDFPTSCLFAPTNEWLLLLDQSLNLGYGPEGQYYQDPDVLPQLYNATGYGFTGTEWTTKSIKSRARIDPHSNPPEYATVTARMALCVAGTKNTWTNITAKADTNATEPVYGSFMGTSLRTDPGDINTASIRKQLANSDDFQERGILNLTAYKREENHTFSVVFSDIYKPSWTSFFNTTRSYNISILPWDLATAYQEIFNSMLLTGDSSIVFAIQAIFSLVTTQYFYTLLLNERDVQDFRESIANGTLEAPSWASSTAHLQTAQTVSVPTRKRGLFILCGLVSFHLITVVNIFWMFFTCRAPKFLDQAWLTLAQLHTGETTGDFVRTQVTSPRGDTEVAQIPGARAVAIIGSNDIGDYDQSSLSQDEDPESVQLITQHNVGEKKGSQDQAGQSERGLNEV